MNRFFFFAIISFSLNLKAQNLVPNGSFEDFTTCPTTTSQVDNCIGWHNVLNTPDYFSTCSPYPVAIPDNFVGSQLPFNGNSYIGLITYFWFETYREFICTQLIDTIIPDQPYHISMRVSRGNWTNQNYNVAASNGLGMYFSKTAYNINYPPPINNQANVWVDSVVTDTINWVLLQWNFTPDSAYTHVYIGNFFTDTNTDTLVINAPLGQFGIAYYFIDSINVSCIGEKCNTIVQNLPIPNESLNWDSFSKIFSISIGSNEVAYFKLFNCTGQIIISEKINGNNNISLSSIKCGIYIAELKTSNGSLVKKVVL